MKIMRPGVQIRSGSQRRKVVCGDVKSFLPLTVATLFSLLLLSPAHAGAMRTYVSGTGDDSNPCTFSAPCRTLNAALTLTLPGGEVQSLNSADYGSVTISQSVTIIGAHGVAGMLAPNVSGITINAGATDTSNSPGLDIDGGGSGANAILFTSGAALNVEDSVIHNFANGIAISASNAHSFSIKNTSIFNNTVALGVQTSATSLGTLSGVQLVNNGTGLSAAGGSSSSQANLTVQDSIVANNDTTGVLAGNFSIVTVANSMVANNGVGLQAMGSGLLWASRSTLTGNATGWTTANGGQVLSTGNNAIGGNLSGNTAPPTSPAAPTPTDRKSTRLN